MDTAVPTLTRRVQIAHGDLWQVEGRIRHGAGGGARAVPGARLMASGLQDPRLNAADVEDEQRFDVASAASWFAAVANGAGVPWSARVPAGRPWRDGRFLGRLRLAALVPGALRAPRAVAGLRVREARDADIDVVAAVNAEIFDADLALSSAWIGPQLRSARHHVVLGTLDGAPAGVGVGARSFDRAGPALGVTGVGVLEHARGRGVAEALIAELAARGLAAGAMLVHATLRGDEDAARHAALGFAEVDGLDAYVVACGAER